MYINDININSTLENSIILHSSSLWSCASLNGQKVLTVRNSLELVTATQQTLLLMRIVSLKVTCDQETNISNEDRVSNFLE